ncbi:uncharacterized protein PITG_12583 [Phytophthora infestans T30-4]|uniref:Uncharacterized protein n=1 Tax=Phytophthora infestans (strain T30-4) TaxID=403677 RepID=D0NKW0_PHYIT|nr:uncharacterized protein PITG_12583 [Phytophthora infestans T30-4]EEY60246.1 hypothetical protein PITG_12583 [Phytophthora infestans T30-4]|eukprot:XP_002900453.1 hypothetical protein PITG_12583 [Phytophthora infestans T30-4]
MDQRITSTPFSNQVRRDRRPRILNQGAPVSITTHSFSRALVSAATVRWFSPLLDGFVCPPYGPSVTEVVSSPALSSQQMAPVAPSRRR